MHPPPDLIPSSRPPPRAGRLSGFTLLELLIVIGIMVMMMGILAPAFSSIGKGTSLRTAGNQVSNLLNLARANSMSKNVMTALVLLTNNTDGAYRAFLLMQRAAGDSGTTTNWVQASKWETLRDGVLVSPTNAFLLTGGFTANPPTPPLPSTGITYRGTPIDLTANCASVVFLPKGSLYGVSTPYTLQLIPAYLQSGSVVTMGTNNFYKLTILPSTGRVKIDRP